MTRWARLAALCAAAGAVAACGPSAVEFREADPTGYDACSAFAQAQGAGGETYRALVGEAADLGLKADTAAVRAAVDDRNGGADGDPVLSDLDGFRGARCEPDWLPGGRT